MGVHLSHRFEMLFRHYVVVANEFGLVGDGRSENESLPFDLKDVVSAFARSKILPWISFHREDPAPGSFDTKREALQAWAEDEKLESYATLKMAVETIIEDSGMTYEYMGS